MQNLSKKVMVFGTFDQIHDGHRFFIQEAAKLGNILTVVVARDQTVHDYKGRKPVNTDAIRVDHVAKEFPGVDVVLGDKIDGSWNIIRDENPDIIALGYDQKEIENALIPILDTFDKQPKIVSIPDHRGDELHSSILRQKQ